MENDVLNMIRTNYQKVAKLLTVTRYNSAVSPVTVRRLCVILHDL